VYSTLTLFAVCVWVLANPTTGLSDAITLDPRIFPLDSFNLITDIAFDGKSIWVAGFDQVVRLNANYTVAQRIKVDGHIASLGLGSDGAIYVADDKTVWQISRGSETLKKISRTRNQ